ncbi:MAG TPA: SRPBCC family protein [Arsenicitalea sp.]|nr:SRPBCC family protein [Arsenicitalea sp.]
MTAHQTITAAPIRKQLVVKAAPSRAFEIFTAGIGGWWPRDKSIGTTPIVDVVLEPFAGGRWYEKNADGRECEWGKVLVWEPGKRLTLNWQIGANWQHNASLHTEVEINFVAAGEGTQVTLEHRNIESISGAPQLRAGLDSGWQEILGSFAVGLDRA